jgi:hypothetical protein
MAGEIRVKRTDERSFDVVSDDNALPVAIVETSAPGRMVVWDIPISVSTGAYSAGDAVGQSLLFGGAARTPTGCGTIISLTLKDLSDAGAAMNLVLFDDIFTPTADNATMAITDADAYKCIGGLVVATTDYVDFGSFRIATIRNQVLGYRCKNGNLYGQLMTSGTPTYALYELQLRMVALLD